MLAIERQRRILEQLRASGSLRTTETAKLLDVTDETVRKDFEVLEKRGELIRIHGGASKPERIREDQPFSEREAVRRNEKQAIARVAANRIQPNETIFLDASSTTLALTRFLPEVPLTVVTNAIHVIQALDNRPHIDLVCTGGLYESRSRSFIGLIAERSLQRYNIHRLFFSGNGLHLERGISERNSRQAAFKERLIACSEDVVMLADHTKLGEKSSFFFGEATELSWVITDSAAAEDFTGQLEDLGVEVLRG